MPQHNHCLKLNVTNNVVYMNIRRETIVFHVMSATSENGSDTGNSLAEFYFQKSANDKQFNSYC